MARSKKSLPPASPVRRAKTKAVAPSRAATPSVVTRGAVGKTRSEAKRRPWAVFAKLGALRLSARVAYGAVFVLLWLFFAWVYGDVFAQAARESYFSCDAEAMNHLLRKPWGEMAWAARALLLLYKWKALGALLMATLLTSAVWALERPLRAVSSWRGVGFVPVLALLAFLLYRGLNLYLRNEPSTFVLLVVALTLLCWLFAAAWVVVKALGRRSTSRKDDMSEVTAEAVSSPKPQGAFPGVAVLTLGLYAALCYWAMVPNANVRAVSRMLGEYEEEDWAAMVEEARRLPHPTRGMAALHALALHKQNLLLEGVFAIPYDFPKLKLDAVNGGTETVLYMAECNLHAGLVNSGYRAAMETVVILGPRLRQFKTLALCALLNGEAALARKYFFLIDKMPFTADFTERYRRYIGHPERLKEDASFAQILKLAPMEHRFEQQYRMPTFLGYNAGLNQGSSATLVTSIATCLYSKDLNEMLTRAAYMRRHTALPATVLQAIMVASVSREGLLQSFPEVTQHYMDEMQRFMADAGPYLQRVVSLPEGEEKMTARREMAVALRKTWLGTYYYYYFCGNMAEAVQQEETHGVN